MEYGESGLRPVQFGNRYRPVQSMQRRRGHTLEHGIQVGDFLPTRLWVTGREAMLCGDARFGVEPGEYVAIRRACQPLQANTDTFAIPYRAVLFFQEQQASHG